MSLNEEERSPARPPAPDRRDCHTGLRTSIQKQLHIRKTGQHTLCSTTDVRCWQLCLQHPRPKKRQLWAQQNIHTVSYWLAFKIGSQVFPSAKQPTMLKRCLNSSSLVKSLGKGIKEATVLPSTTVNDSRVKSTAAQIGKCNEPSPLFLSKAVGLLSGLDVLQAPPGRKWIPHQDYHQSTPTLK